MRKMTQICLVRHGQTDWNVQRKLQGKTDIPLNRVGRRQARECCNHLKESAWDVLISSPLVRAKETAEIINEEIHLPIEEMEEFMERSFGDAEGLTMEERDRLYSYNQYPNQEVVEDFKARIIAGLKKINERFPTEKVLLVCHGAVIRMILSIFSGEEQEVTLPRLENGCLNTIHFEEGNWKIKEYNLVGHLSEHN
jgi:uncharacterized phosphatase